MRIDELRAPLLVTWQLTRNCDLACLHCCTESGPRPPVAGGGGGAQALPRGGGGLDPHLAEGFGLGGGPPGVPPLIGHDAPRGGAPGERQN